MSYVPPPGSGGSGAPTTAPYVTTAADAGLSNESLLSALIGRGTLAARPAFGVAGRLYFVTDDNTLYRDSGSAWEIVESAGGGSAPTNATYLTTTADATLTNEVLLSAVVGRGTLASRPSAATAGRLYFVTDNSTLYRDNGTTWEAIEGAGAGGGAFQQMLTVAKSGGQYSTIQSAIDAITDNDAAKRYLVLVHPGLYAEQVTMKPWVFVCGTDRPTVQITHGASAGAVIMDSNCGLANLTIENSVTEGHWGIVATNKSGIDIHHVSMLAPFGSSYRGAGIKITGTSWSTVFLQDVVINTYTQTNQGVYIQSDGTDLADVNLKSCFVDALEATSGGAFLLDAVEDIHLRDCYSRVASAAYCLRVTGGSVVDVTACYFESGTNSVEVDNSTVYFVGTPITNSAVSGGGNLMAAGRGVVVQKLGQSVANATDVAMSFTAASVQQANRFNSYWASGSPTRFTAPHHGWYICTGFASFAANATGRRYAHIRKGGSTFLSMNTSEADPVASVPTFLSASAVWYLNAGEYLEFVVHQTSGGSLAVSCDAAFAHWF